MSRRRYLKNQSGSSYRKKGLSVWIDGILNSTEAAGSIVDQTGNYTLTKLDSTNTQNYSNYIQFTNTRFLIPCNDILSTNKFTIQIVYQKNNNNSGFIWSLCDPTTYLNGRVTAGHNTLNSNYWRLYFERYDYGLTDHLFSNNSQNIESVTYIRDEGFHKLYHGGYGGSQESTLYINNAGLDFVLGGYMNNNQMYESCKLYSLRIYDRVLTEKEIQDNLAVDERRFNFNVL